MNLPAEWADVERVQLEFDPSCEAMIFDTEGCPLQGITGGGGIDRRVEFILPKEKRASGYKCAFLSLSRAKNVLLFLFPRGGSLTTFRRTRRLHRGLVQCHVRQRTLRDECAARHEPVLHCESPSRTRFTLPGRPQRLTSGCTSGWSARSSRVQTSSSREWRRGDCCGISGELKTAVLARQPRSPRLMRNSAGF